MGVEHEAITLDPASPAALYRQLAEALRHRISTGAFAPGDRLPTEQALSQELGVSLSTVRNAYARLVKEGLVTRRAGQGSFVAAPAFDRGLGGVYNFTAEMERLGKTPVTHVLSFETVEAAGAVREALELQGGQTVYEIKRLRCDNAEPLLLETSWVPAALCPGLEGPDVEASLYEALAKKAGLVAGAAREVHEAVVLDKAVARALDRKAGCPAFRIVRTTRTDGGTPFEYSEAYAPGDATRYVMDLDRRHASVSKNYAGKA